MFVLGPVGEGTRRDQCRKWIAFLDAARLAWWGMEHVKASMKLARARVEDGELPPMILEQACHEGMRRVACLFPYILWGPGPWDVAPMRRVAGFWPCKRRIMRALGRRILPAAGHASLWSGAQAMTGSRWRKLGAEQRYWLHVEERQYQLLGLNGKGIWIMHGRWSHV